MHSVSLGVTVEPYVTNFGSEGDAMAGKASATTGVQRSSRNSEVPALHGASPLQGPTGARRGRAGEVVVKSVVVLLLYQLYWYFVAPVRPAVLARLPTPLGTEPPPTISPFPTPLFTR